MNRAFHIIGNTFLVFVTVACTFGALISAFEFTVDFLLLFLVWAAASLLAVLLVYFRQAKG